MGLFRSDDFGDTFREVNQVSKKLSLNSTSINTLVLDPGNPGSIYFGSSSGIFHSTDQGQNWKYLLTGMLVADIAVDPTDPNIIYSAGTSENHATIIKTFDGGGSWKAAYTEPTTSTTVSTIAIDPADHNRLLAGLQTGEIIVSRDAGQTWQSLMNLNDRILIMRYGPNKHPYILGKSAGVFEARDNQNFVNISGQLTGAILDFDSTLSSVSQFLDMQFDRRQTGVIYVATPEGLIRTVDDGNTWAYLRMPVRNSLLRTSAVAINPEDSNNIFATVGHTLFRSINGGLTWETKPLPTGQETRIILIDPSSPNTIYFGFGARK